ncbi:hypothetical protein ENSA5_36940 [Enhygromyxa salina]|uniref:Uncharacterized protein n=1 Tax=Enhygromyxa salina TaxID=215803 RepID=A0A2S9XSI6_9BACT|nr:hypothetical protein [Enhygromyxa salina]PRP95825.1 hypothetical protein ENSA5_36940 [Enhygromyxa salina]
MKPTRAGDEPLERELLVRRYAYQRCRARISLDRRVLLRRPRASEDR